MSNLAIAQEPAPEDSAQTEAAHKSPETVELEKHGVDFAQSIITAFDDFFGVEAALCSEIQVDKGYRSEGNVHLSIPFSGPVQGEYILSFSESLAAEILGCDLPDPQENEAIAEFREEMGPTFSELLNTAVGTVIGELAHNYEHLCFSSPRISYGFRVYPKIRMASVDLECEHGRMGCHFYIDHMQLDLAVSYEKLRIASDQAQAALNEHLAMFDRILATVRSAIFWVHDDGRISERASAVSSSILGVDLSSKHNLRDLLRCYFEGPEFEVQLEEWMNTAFSMQDSQEWERVAAVQCPVRRASTEDGRRLLWRWVPVWGTHRRPKTLLVAVDEESADTGNVLSATPAILEQIALTEALLAQRAVIRAALDRAAELIASNPVERRAEVDKIVLRAQEQVACIAVDEELDEAKMRQVQAFRERISQSLPRVAEAELETLTLPLSDPNKEVDIFRGFSLLRRGVLCRSGSSQLVWRGQMDVASGFYCIWFPVVSEWVLSVIQASPSTAGFGFSFEAQQTTSYAAITIRVQRTACSPMDDDQLRTWITPWLSELASKLQVLGARVHLSEIASHVCECVVSVTIPSVDGVE